MTDGTRPLDPATLRALTGALATARAGARSDADTLLTHVPDVGDPVAQRLLDAWVEQAADTLRALSECLEERLLELGSSVAPPSAVRPGAWRP